MMDYEAYADVVVRHDLKTMKAIMEFAGSKAGKDLGFTPYPHCRYGQFSLKKIWNRKPRQRARVHGPYFGLPKVKVVGYEEARIIARRLAIEKGLDTGTYSKLWGSELRSLGVPGAPDRYYRSTGEWKGWGDFLGRRRGMIVDFEMARSKARGLALTHLIVNMKNYKSCLRKHGVTDLTRSPEGVFSGQWQGVDDWLGTEEVLKKAREIVAGIKITSIKDWKERQVHKNVRGCVSMMLQRGMTWPQIAGDSWIMPQPKQPRWMPYGEALIVARELAKKYRLRRKCDWRSLYREGGIPNNIPVEPDQISEYRCRWKGWMEWFGINSSNSNVPIPVNQIKTIVVKDNDIAERDDEEIWKTVVVDGYDNELDYQVSSHGRVYCRGTGDFVQPFLIGGRKKESGFQYRQHLAVRLKGHPAILVHRLVAWAYIPNPEAKKCVNHINGDPQNNHVWNLEWVTQRENNYHAILTGLRKRELSTEAVAEVKRLLANGLSRSDVACKTGLKVQTVTQIDLGKTYKWVGIGQYVYPISGIEKRFRLTDEQREKIEQMVSQGRTLNDVAKEAGVCRATVYDFYHHRRRESVPEISLSPSMMIEVGGP